MFVLLPSNETSSACFYLSPPSEKARLCLALLEHVPALAGDPPLIRPAYTGDQGCGAVTFLVGSGSGSV